MIAMALHWDITNCADTDLLSDEQASITDAMIWATMFTGIGTITEKNVAEFHTRLIVGGYWSGEPLPYSEVRRYIGLSTNVGPEETRAKWLKRIIGARMDEEVRAAERSLSEVSNG